jgi:hypothetical protein|tara:strand:- start:4577 stop:5359 length:783 start_codon:yes stop_codon:yes gene_type:complete
MKHISYSGLRTWIDCPYKHKIEYIDKYRIKVKNIYIDFGSAVHYALEKCLSNDEIDICEIFEQEYKKLVTENRKEFPESYNNSDNEWILQGKNILSEIDSFLEKEFKNYKIISKEEELFEDIDGTNIKFKGFIDLVIKHENKIYIIDYKTTSWGWNKFKKSDKLIALQLQLYKYFWSKKHNVSKDEQKNIKLCFLLLKRTAKKNRIEVVSVSGTEYKTNQAIAAINNALNNVSRQKSIRNRLSCKNHFGVCPYYKTPHCP